MKTLFKPSQEAIKAGADVFYYDPEKPQPAGQTAHEFYRQSLSAAYAIDEEAITNAWLASQWIPFEEKEKLIDGKFYLVKTTKNFGDGELFICQWSSQHDCFFVDNYGAKKGFTSSFNCAFPLKAMGV
jgi:hypothetical protein